MNVEINQHASSSGNEVIINGEKIQPPPKRLLFSNRSVIIQEGKKVYINGFLYKDGKYSRSLIGLIKCLL